MAPWLRKIRRGDKLRRYIISASRLACAAVAIGSALVSCGRVQEAIGPKHSVARLGVSKPSSATATQHLPPFTIVDVARAWSRSSKLVAFSRVVPSSLGPAGLYLINRNGAKLSFITAGSTFWPAEVSFSPMDDKLAWVDRHVLYVAVLGAPNARAIAYLVQAEDWAPEGDSLVIARSYNYPGPDSSGVWIVSSRTGTGRALLAGGAPVHGLYVRWSPDGLHVVLLEARFGSGPLSVGWDIAQYDVRTGTRETLVSYPPDEDIRDLTWINRPGEGPRLTWSIIGGPSGTRGGIYSYDPVAKTVTLAYGNDDFDWARLSPTQRAVAHLGFQAADSIGVVFIAKEHRSGEPDKQLTQYTQ